MSIQNSGRKRLRLFWAQHGRCAGCNDFMDPEAGCNAPDFPTLDHVIAKASGGLGEIGNLLLKHRRCNDAKADAPPTERDLAWQSYVADRLAAQPTPGEVLAREVDEILASVEWRASPVSQRRKRRGGWGVLVAGLPSRLIGSFQFIPLQEAG